MDVFNGLCSAASYLASLPTPVLLVLTFVSVLLLIGLQYFGHELLTLEMGISANAETSGVFIEDPNSTKRIRVPSVFSPPSKTFSLILPAYNEQDRLVITLEETLRYFQTRIRSDSSFTYEIIVVDDGSTDGTARVAVELGKKKNVSVDNLRVVRLGVNMGKGAAVRKGMLCARGELILFADADGATHIADLEKLETEMQSLVQTQLLLSKRDIVSRSLSSSPAVKSVAKARSVAGEGGEEEEEASDGFDEGVMSQVPAVVFGSRAHLEQEALATRKWYRNILMLGFHFCVLLVAGTGIRDTQCGFKMFSRAAVRQLVLNQRLNRWCFDVELVCLCKWLLIPLAEVAVTWAEIPGSKIRITSIIHMLFELTLVRVGYGLRFWKIRKKLVR